MPTLLMPIDHRSPFNVQAYIDTVGLQQPFQAKHGIVFRLVADILLSAELAQDMALVGKIASNILFLSEA